MSQYVPDGEMVGEGVEVPWTQESVEEVRDVEGGTTEEVAAQAGGESREADQRDIDAGPAETPLTPDLERQLTERTEDLQRLQAEYVNYKRRVDRDRDLARNNGVAAVMVDLLPVLDAIALAGQHEELTGGFKLVADELTKVTSKYGLASYGEVGEPFDPQVHDALMQVPGEPGQTEPLVGQVLQTGWRVGERIVRHARVAVSEPGA